MYAVGDGLAVSFGTNGLYSYDGSVWEKLTTLEPENRQPFSEFDKSQISNTSEKCGSHNGL
jgi:hypothetical protein